MNYRSLSEVKDRIYKNELAINQVKELFADVDTVDEKLGIAELVGKLYSEYITGIYSDSVIEQKIIEMASPISELSSLEDAFGTLIVMSQVGYVGGHGLLVNEWIRWDNNNSYSVFFTDTTYEMIPTFIKEAVKESGGQIYVAKGSYRNRAEYLHEVSLKYERVVLFTHMEDIIPLLAYGKSNWKRPIYFYNHADFRFSYGFTVADIVLNLFEYDSRRTIQHRGISREKSICLQYPGQGVCNDIVAFKTYNKNELRKKYGVNENKLIVSMGADYKYEEIIGYDYCSFIKELLACLNEKVFFLIIGADPERERWKQLKGDTNGFVYALGTLPLQSAYDLIASADLFISSFPMISCGASIAELFGVPSLTLDICGRTEQMWKNIVVSSLGELLERTVSILKGTVIPEVGNNIDTMGKDEWKNCVHELYGKQIVHETNVFHPVHEIGTQEYINCQLMQENAGKQINNYLITHPVSDKVLNKIKEIDCQYNMGIFRERNIPTNYLKTYRAQRYNDRLLDMLYKYAYVTQSKSNVSEYFRNKGYTKIALYGIGRIGKLLIHEFEKSEIECVYGIDRNAENIHVKIKIIPPGDCMDKVDVILNTTLYENSQLIKNLSDQSIKMVQFEYLINTLFIECAMNKDISI